MLIACWAIHTLNIEVKNLVHVLGNTYLPDTKQERAGLRGYAQFNN